MTPTVAVGESDSRRAVRGFGATRFSIAPTVTLTALGLQSVVAAQSSGHGSSSQPEQFTYPAFSAVSVADLEASTAWYRTTLGLAQAREVEPRDGRGSARILRGGQLVVGLIHYQASRAAQDRLGENDHPLQLQGLFKTGIFVDDAHRMHAALQRSGAVFAPCADCRD